VTRTRIDPATLAATPPEHRAGSLAAVIDLTAGLVMARVQGRPGANQYAYDGETFTFGPESAGHEIAFMPPDMSIVRDILFSDDNEEPTP
jgi:hypothetical protein